jgi:hypothetical protein
VLLTIVAESQLHQKRFWVCKDYCFYPWAKHIKVHTSHRALSYSELTFQDQLQGTAIGIFWANVSLIRTGAVPHLIAISHGGLHPISLPLLFWSFNTRGETQFGHGLWGILYCFTYWLSWISPQERDRPVSGSTNLNRTNTGYRIWSISSGESMQAWSWRGFIWYSWSSRVPFNALQRHTRHNVN